MREMGIALATATSAWVNTLLLCFFLLTRNHMNFDNKLIKNSIKILISSLIFFVILKGFDGILFGDIGEKSLFFNLILLPTVIFLAIIMYLGIVIVLRVLSINQLREYLEKLKW